MKTYFTVLILSFYCTINYAQSNVDSTLAKIPFQLINNHIYLNLLINNSKPLWFVLDTGAPSIIDLKQAKKLNLALYSSLKTEGVGNASQDASLTNNISFQLNNTTYIEQVVAVIELSGIEECANRLVVDSLGNITRQDKKKKSKSNYQPMNGVLGANFFKSFVVEINYRQKYILLHDPNNYHYDGNGKIIPIDVTGTHIFTNATVRGSDSQNIEGRFMIDTGSMLAIIFNTPFIEKYNLLPPSSQTTPFSVCGLGGNSNVQISTIRNLFIQDVGIGQLPAIFSQATGGVLSSTEFDGHIGNAVLRHFNVIFDYSNKRMILD